MKPGWSDVKRFIIHDLIQHFGLLIAVIFHDAFRNLLFALDVVPEPFPVDLGVFQWFWCVVAVALILVDLRRLWYYDQ